MRSHRSERGAVSVGLIVALFLLLFAVYEAIQFGPLLIAQYEFQDAVLEAAKFSRGQKAEAVQAEVLKRAQELQLPISREMIVVTRQPQNTRIQVTYELATDWLPGKPYSWVVEVDAESVLF